MKTAIQVSRIIVGLLFIFSGLVKANDPLGLSYKMEEYFEIWEMTQFNSITLTLSVLMNAFEIIAGFALLLGWRIKIFSWLLLLLILFFTFLTGYTFVTGKPTNCGCFGDCLPITAKTSFLKDLALTLLIGYIFWNRKKIKPVFSERASIISMLAIAIFSFGFQWYTLNYLPVVDCLPFKKGNDITEKRKMPANAIPDSTVITFVYLKEGKEIEFTADKFPGDFNSDTYQFVKRYDKLIRKGKNNEPPIKGFVLTSVNDVDSTQFVLKYPYCVLLFCENFSNPVKSWQKQFEEIYNEARQKNIPIYLVTSRMDQVAGALQGTGFSDIPVFKCDLTAIRTAARTNPCLYILNEGTVTGKWSDKNFDEAASKLKEIPAQQILLPESPGIPIDSTTDQ